MSSIGVAAGLLGSVAQDLFGKSTGTAATDGDADAFASMVVAQVPASGVKNLALNDGDDSAASDPTANMDAGTKDAYDTLNDMTSGGVGGYFAWMMKQTREKVMDEMGVSDASLAAMDPAVRAAVEKKIDEEVKERLKKAMGMDGDSKDAKKGDPLLNPVKLSDDAAKQVAVVQPAQETKQADANKAYKDDADMVSMLASAE